MSDALDALYDVFEKYPRPKTFVGCECCFSGSELAESGPWLDISRPIEALSPGGATPLRELSAEDLEGFFGDVPLTSGDTALVKHYLPRAFELAAYDERFESPFIVWGNMRWNSPPRFVPWMEWPATERVAISEFLQQAWKDTCKSAASRAADILEGIIDIEDDMAPYLAVWAAAPLSHLDRLETFGWIERPGNHEWNKNDHALQNWQTVKTWLDSR